MTHARHPGSNAAGSSATVLDVNALQLVNETNGMTILHDVHLRLSAGEVLGIVGESGSGKSMLAKTILRLQPSNMVVRGGSITAVGQPILQLDRAAIRKVRGAGIGMVFQEPMTTLNPALRIGRQLDEGLALHQPAMKSAARTEAIDTMLRGIGLTDPVSARHAFPHQFSGGMRQRILLASVMLLKPALLIADEPTTALDVLVQRDVLELMMKLTRKSNTAVLMISHDLGLIAHYSDRIAVMERGRIVEAGEATALLAAPSHPYTRQLLAATPQRRAQGGDAAVAARAATIAAALAQSSRESGQPLLELRGISMHFNKASRRFWQRRRHGPSAAASLPALDQVSMKLWPGETAALVGGSGSGKTTLGRIIAGLRTPTTGELLYKGNTVASGEATAHAARRHALRAESAAGPAKRSQFADYRYNCQLIFQDPFASLDPRMTIGEIVLEGLGPDNVRPGGPTMSAVDALREVELDPALASRFPHELSGGQRQRVAIARALIRRPALIIADEAVSALDMTVRQKILALLKRLQREYGFACLFITHDLAALEFIADRVIVMHKGRIIESGSKDAILYAPEQDYTKALLDAHLPLESLPDGGVRLLKENH